MVYNLDMKSYLKKYFSGESKMNFSAENAVYVKNVKVSL